MKKNNKNDDPFSIAKANILLKLMEPLFQSTIYKIVFLLNLMKLYLFEFIKNSSCSVIRMHKTGLNGIRFHPESEYMNSFIPVFPIFETAHWKYPCKINNQGKNGLIRLVEEQSVIGPVASMALSVFISIQIRFMNWLPKKPDLRAVTMEATLFPCMHKYSLQSYERHLNKDVMHYILRVTWYKYH